MSDIPIDTSNLEAVSMQGDTVVIMRRGIRLTQEEALNLAAWLVALADSNGRFQEVLNAVLDT